MIPRSELFGSRSLPEPEAGAERGYALLIVIMATTLLLIALTAALPSVYTAGQREREEELIFRGNEYARAIALFQRQFRRYPTSVKELLQTNGIRFLRREYPDPMSRKGKWRFIHADASGAILDSKTLGAGKRSQQPGSQPLPTTKAEEERREKEKAAQEAEEEASGSSSSFFDRESKGGFIVGVASRGKKKSIRVWNGRSRYDEWEFIGVTLTQAGPGVGPGPSPRPGQPGQPSPFPPHQTQPSTTPTGSPFTSGPGPR